MQHFGGGYCRKSDVAKLNEMFTRHRKELEDAIAGDKTGQGFICDMFLQELENHEYSYTGDVQETLDALGITDPVYGGGSAAAGWSGSGLVKKANAGRLFRLIQKETMPHRGLNQQPPQLSCRRRAFH